MAMLSSLLCPTRLLSFEAISADDFARAAAYLGRGPRRVAAVVDGRPFPARDALVDGLKRAFDTVVLDKVSPDPLASDIDAMLESGALDGVRLVVGIGGGSVLDSAKALAALAPAAAAGARLSECLGPAPARRIEAKGLPLLLVPTTAGTGAEVTKVGVYRDGSGRKHTLGSPFFQADAALLVGELAAAMPPALAASTGFDALSHALESLWNRNASSETIEAATAAAVAVLGRLPRSYEAAKAVAAGGRAEPAAALAMLEASAMAGLAFGITGTAMGHALSFVLSEEWRVPHGAACAFTIEDCFRWALRDPAIKERLTRVGVEALGAPPEGAAAALLARVLELKGNMGLPSSFRDLGVGLPRSEVRRLFARAFDDPKMANTRPTADPEAVYAFLEAKAC
jgi:alcohol dehydrogenase class IV